MALITRRPLRHLMRGLVVNGSRGYVLKGERTQVVVSMKTPIGFLVAVGLGNKRR